MIYFPDKFFRSLILFLAFVFTLLPFLYIAQYNHPAADDFCYARKVNHLGFLATQIDHWLTWSGRYTATAFLSLYTIDHNYLFNYRIAPILLFTFFLISIFIFLKALIPKTSNYDICAIGFVIFFLYIFNAPNITEAFYWLAGSITYQLAVILSLLLFSLILHHFRINKKTDKILITILGAILGVIIVGLNEIILIYLCIILTLWLIIRLYILRKPDWYFISIILATYIAAGISLGAPGNYKRMSYVMMDQFNLVFSTSGSIQLAFLAILSWLPFLLLFFLIFIRPLKRVAIRLKEIYNVPHISKKFVILLGIFLFGLIALGYFPTYWSQGGRPPTRTINTIYLIFLFGSVGIILISLMRSDKIKMTLLKVNPSLVSLLAVIALISYTFLSSNNIKNVYEDLYLGKAMKYDIEMKNRYLQLSNCKEELCDISPIENRPATIFAIDLGGKPEDQNYYYNICLKDYFYKTYTQ